MFINNMTCSVRTSYSYFLTIKLFHHKVHDGLQHSMLKTANTLILIITCVTNMRKMAVYIKP